MRFERPHQRCQQRPHREILRHPVLARTLRPLAETTLAGTINEEYIYFNGVRIARVDRPSGTVHDYFSDHLGSASVITDALGNITRQDFYFPYGGELPTPTGSDSNHDKFTGKERDAESNLDNFGARYYTSNIGRFMTPDWNEDPDPVPYADLRDPQSLNLYSYVRNNPMNSTDDDGHECTTDENGNIHCVVTAKAEPDIPEFIKVAAVTLPWDWESPPGWFIAGGIGVTCVAMPSCRQGIVNILSQDTKNTNTPPPADASSSTSKTASPNPDPTGQKPKPVQSGNSKTVSKGAAKALNKAFNKNLSPREWGRALEALKSDNNVPNNFHGQIMSNGDFVGNGATIANIGDYLP